MTQFDPRLELINRWNMAKKTLQESQEIEINLRKQVVELCFDKTIEKGTEHFPLPNNYKLTCTKTQNIKVNTEELDKVLDKLSEGVAELLVKWTPTIQFSVFNNMSDEDKTLVQTCYQETPGSPQLKLIEPKA